MVEQLTKFEKLSLALLSGKTLPCLPKWLVWGILFLWASMVTVQGGEFFPVLFFILLVVESFSDGEGRGASGHLCKVEISVFQSLR